MDQNLILPLSDDKLESICQFTSLLIDTQIMNKLCKAISILYIVRHQSYQFFSLLLRVIIFRGHPNPWIKI